MPQQRRTRKPRAAKGPFQAPRELIVIADPQAGFTVRPGSVEAAAVAAAPIDRALSGAEAQMRPLFGATEERVRYELTEQAALTGEAPPISRSTTGVRRRTPGSTSWPSGCSAPRAS